jgi:hypothetical protein
MPYPLAIETLAPCEDSDSEPVPAGSQGYPGEGKRPLRTEPARAVFFCVNGAEFALLTSLAGAFLFCYCLHGGGCGACNRGRTKGPTLGNGVGLFCLLKLVRTLPKSKTTDYGAKTVWAIFNPRVVAFRYRNHVPLRLVPTAGRCPPANARRQTRRDGQRSSARWPFF